MTVIKAQAKRAVCVNAVEAAADRLVGAGMNGELGADRVRARQPGLRQRRRFALPPQPDEPGHASGKKWSEGLRSHASTKRRAGPARQVGGRSKVHTEADHHSVAASFEEDPGQLLPVKKQVVGPFEHQRLSWERGVDGLDQSEAGRQRQGLRLGVRRAQLDDRTSVEIPDRRMPLAPLPSPARLLLERDEPVALYSRRIGDKIGVGRAGALDETDAGQNSVPAARSVSVPSGPISR